ncbi:ImmA/IrrE family metallo-endopeptidase [Bacillus mycoides]|uniref:ImmA/IrrE family metallo-endopeptidase n=1 Tax=Bacillus mycoides TaxID=1405 RepID=UPI003D301D05
MKFVINNTINQLCKKHNTKDPFELAQCLNINIFFYDLHEEINGFYKYEKRNKFIAINSNLSSTMQRTVCAHELGHAVLHPQANTPFLRKNTFLSVDKLEIEANIFAALLLIDTDSITPGDTKACIAYKNNIPVELLEFYTFANKRNNLITN